MAESPPPRIVVTIGEPAGIGPDIALRAAAREFPARLAFIGDRGMLAARARAIGGVGATVKITDYAGGPHRRGRLAVIHRPCPAPVSAGKLTPANSEYAVACIDAAVDMCVAGEFDAMTTGPVHKAAINRAGISFTGHTEWIAARCGAPAPVMMLAAAGLRVCLLTCHLPLADVPRRVTRERLIEVITVMRGGLRQLFALAQPRIGVCGLNPHAGEDGCLGREDADIIAPALDELRARGFELAGPIPADTAFTPARLKTLDAVLAMYHDQGLPVIKHAGFGAAVNLTLGLPIIRTSVDHGTALELAGGAGPAVADESSLRAAIEMAIALAGRKP